jgi:hypothetical protein
MHFSTYRWISAIPSVTSLNFREDDAKECDS